MTEPARLSAQDRAILDFERRWSGSSATKRQAIQDRFQVHAATYYRWRAALIQRPEALEYAPALVRRLRGRPAGS